MSINDYTKLLLLRSLINDMKMEENEMPIIKSFSILNVEKRMLKVTNFKNIKSVIDRKNTIIDMFDYDHVLNSLWNDPLKYIVKFKNVFAVSTPDFSVYPQMSRFEIEHNVFKSRWVGSFWQSYGINVIPTVSWATSETYDICFSGIEKGSTVMISTIGTSKNEKAFLDGFNEMMSRLEPSVVIVVGKLLPKMYGRFLVYSLTDTFNQKKSNEQLTLFELSNYTERRKGETLYGR